MRTKKLISSAVFPGKKYNRVVPGLRIILNLCFVFSVLTSTGQQENFRHYEVEAGLSNNSVICSLQDYQGFLWFGTSDGLNRFDGNVFKIFRPNAHTPFSIGSQAITCLFQDRQQRLWVGTAKGLYLYDARYERFIGLPFTKGKYIRTVHDDALGRLWFADAGNLFRISLPSLYSPLGEAFALNYFPDKSVHTVSLDGQYSITCFAEAKNHDIWMGTEQGSLLVLHPGSDKIISYSFPALKKNAVETLLATDDNRLLIGCSRAGLLCMNLQSHTITDSFLKSKKDGDEIFVRNILHYRDNEYWIATEAGLFTIVLNKDTVPSITVKSHLQKNYTNPFALSDNALYTLCKDKEGGVWIGSYFGGINYLPYRTFRFERFFPQSRRASFTGNVVREIAGDSLGNFWIGTEDAGLNKINFSTMQFKHILVKQPDGASHSNIHGLLVDGAKIYAGTFNHGMDVLDISGKLLHNYQAGAASNQLKSNFINAIWKTKSGKILVCTSVGLYYFYPQSGTFENIKELPLEEFYSAITEDHAGNVWIGTHTRGVYFLENGSWQRLSVYAHSNKKMNLLRTTRILYLKEDKANRMWIATENGLFRITNKKTVKIFNDENGLPSNIIYALMPDSLNNMWLSTSNGLVKINASNDNIRVYDKNDGLLSNQFNYQSVYLDNEGLMYFGSVKGLIRFNPYQANPSHYTPPLYFTDLHTYNRQTSAGSSNLGQNKSLLFAKQVTLNHLQSTFSLNFAALSYSAPTHLQFSYKIDEVRPDWTTIQNNTPGIYFTDLAPGSYTLRIRSTNSSGNWVNNEKVLSVKILPPFWKSGLAYVIYAIVLCLLIGTAILMYTRYHSHKNQREVALYKLQHEKELYRSKIDFFTHIAHEIRTPLTLIKGPVDKILESKKHFPHLESYLDLMERNTKRLLVLTQDLLDFRKIETDMIKLELTPLEISQWLNSFVEPYQLVAEQKHISLIYQKPAEDIFAAVDETALAKIINNLLDNALKYAESIIIISLSLMPDNKAFVVQIDNDGLLIPPEFHKKIFEPFFRWNKKRQVKGSGIGLSVSHSLTQMHGGTLIYSNAEEKYNRFQLILPLDAHAYKVELADERL
ncbi:ligand-binding sensor domain-containing protein [Arachidicoccus ginsenosidimutans]|uniref:ligand-binding sensor domain-containing protein n=1 Tax=Arachidicoccus sp. BS20 TaxID=1850526 RepID=UPI0018D4DA38|nr:sensor histidine kinase [Arachidicoccus sp. BS20]